MTMRRDFADEPSGRWERQRDGTWVLPRSSRPQAGSVAPGGGTGGSGGGASSTQAVYLYSTDTTIADPGAGYVRFSDNMSGGNAEVAISHTDNNGVDLTAVITSFQVGDTLILTNEEGAAQEFWYRFDLTENVDAHTGWSHLLVTLVGKSEGSTAPPADTPVVIRAVLAAGVNDHGALAGLGDDDHPHYLTTARGDARYDPLGAAGSGDANHVAAADPHSQYLTTAEGDARYSPTGHDHGEEGAERPYNLYNTNMVPGPGAIHAWAAGGQSWTIRVSKTDADGNPYSLAPMLQGDSVSIVSLLEPMQVWGRFTVESAPTEMLEYWQFIGERYDVTGPGFVGDGEPVMFNPLLVAHNHDGQYDPYGAASSGDAAHVAASDPHSQYADQASVDAKNDEQDARLDGHDDEIAALMSSQTFVGTFDATNDVVASVTTIGADLGYVVGQPLPSHVGHQAEYLIVAVAGPMPPDVVPVPTPPEGVAPYLYVGDWVAAGASSWLGLRYSAREVDHGMTLGLTDDDHPQYLTSARLEGALPARLGAYAKIITDWNNAAENGWYMAASAANDPSGSDGTWWIGLVSVHNADWVTQELLKFAENDAGGVWADLPSRYIRRKFAGAWGEWVPVLQEYGRWNVGGSGDYDDFIISGAYRVGAGNPNNPPTVGDYGNALVVRGRDTDTLFQIAAREGEGIAWRGARGVNGSDPETSGGTWSPWKALNTVTIDSTAPGAAPNSGPQIGDLWVDPNEVAVEYVEKNPTALQNISGDNDFTGYLYNTGQRQINGPDQVVTYRMGDERYLYNRQPARAVFLTNPYGGNWAASNEQIPFELNQGDASVWSGREYVCPLSGWYHISLTLTFTYSSGSPMFSIVVNGSPTQNIQLPIPGGFGGGNGAQTDLVYLAAGARIGARYWDAGGGNAILVPGWRHSLVIFRLAN